MRTEDEITHKATELTATIQEAKKVERTEAQNLALDFALRLTSTSNTIVLLTVSGALAEAHTICRLLLEHFFNVNALLHKEEHRDLLIEHSMGEPSRHLTKIVQGNKKFATLTPENLQKTTEFLTHPDRANDPKAGVNWEQISCLGETAGLYTTYKIYSFLYAHSTLASLHKNLSVQDIAQLYENVWTVLELTRLQIRIKLLAATN